MEIAAHLDVAAGGPFPPAEIAVDRVRPEIGPGHHRRRLTRFATAAGDRLTVRTILLVGLASGAVTAVIDRLEAAASSAGSATPWIGDQSWSKSRPRSVS